MRDFLVLNLNVPTKNIVLLLDEAATRVGILGAIEDLQRRAGQRGDPILLYYAGHGGRSTTSLGWDGSLYELQTLVPHNARSFCDELPFVITCRMIRRLLQDLANKKGDNIVCMLSRDHCLPYLTPSEDRYLGLLSCWRAPSWVR